MEVRTEVRTQEQTGIVDRQHAADSNCGPEVRTAGLINPHPERWIYPPPPTKGRSQIAITMPLNGAEELQLRQWSAEKGVTMPVYVVTALGYELWRLDAARSRLVRPSSRRPVRYALDRRSVTIVLNGEDFEDVWRRSQNSGLRLPQFIRTLLGFDVRQYSNPRTHARDHEMEDAKERLARLALDWKVYLPDY